MNSPRQDYRPIDNSIDTRLPKVDLKCFLIWLLLIVIVGGLIVLSIKTGKWKVI